MGFDSLGNLFPYKVIEINLEEFERLFITNFPNSESRNRLFQNYLSYIRKIKVRLTALFINGLMAVLLPQN